MYDLIIIGGGPAGLTAGLYAGRAKLKTIILEKDSLGGQIVLTDEVANYPGSTEDETGPSLIAKMEAQAIRFGAEIVKECVAQVSLTGAIKTATCTSGTVYEGKTVIIACGGKPKRIGCPGELELTGKGVSYCATCDGDFFTDLEVFVIGGGDTAVEEAIYLTKFARKVSIVHRRDMLRAAQSIQDKAMANEKIHFIWDSVVEEITGDGIVESVLLKNIKTGDLTRHDADSEDGTFGIFVFIGFDAVSELFRGIIKIDAAGYICASEDTHTSIDGVFVAGDVRVKTLRQVVTATADGAIAAMEAEKYVQEMHAMREEVKTC